MDVPQEAAVSEPPGEPEPGSDKADEPEASSTLSDSAARERDREAESGQKAEPESEAAPPHRPEAPAAAPAPQPPWWSQGQPAPLPPGGPQPPPRPSGGPPPQPYHPQPAPAWGYAQPGPPPPPWAQAPPPMGEPPAERDRISVHLIWEGALAVIVIALLIGTAAMTPHQNLTAALGQAGYVGLLAVGLSFSLRTGAPNLAIGSILSFSAMLSAYLITAQQWSKPAAFILAILLATLIGVLLGVLVAVLSVPAWAVTLGAVAVIQAITLSFVDSPIIPVRFGGSYPTALWYGLFFVLSVGGGGLWLVPGVRRALGGGRHPGEPGRWTGPRTGLGAIAGLTGSSFLAGLAAIPVLMRLQAADSTGTNLTTVAFGAVLLGGVSIFGRRAGVFGTLLGVTIVAIVQTLVSYNDGPFWVSTLVVGLAALLGLGASRGIESATDLLNRRPAARQYSPVHPQQPR
jgi:ribose/xylose/arabinose/galactoside ABC-type transport system permease subunit